MYSTPKRSTPASIAVHAETRFRRLCRSYRVATQRLSDPASLVNAMRSFSHHHQHAEPNLDNGRRTGHELAVNHRVPASGGGPDSR